MDEDVRIERADVADAGEVLTLQRAAYVSEAQLHGDPFLPPLVESFVTSRRVSSTLSMETWRR